eukprot:TRINITY_DN39471_c0_g1_i1.p1 TRINITY_DN39471_c0_g1~~TRINITY_DN39471_c0_g1_i1.p1  ORF type:complete len:616 (+),score=115.11 TRINITY_DN39471_c0_g1_i1:39-1886(+)
MSIELEHAIGCNVEFKRICHLHPNGRDYVKAVGGVVIVGDLSDPHAQVFCRGHDDFVTCLAVSHQGRLFASGQQGQNADVILWSFESKMQLNCWQEQDHGIDALAFSHDDRFLISCGDIVDQRVFVYDTNSGLIIAWAQLFPKPTICCIAGGMVRDIKRRDTHEYQYAACGGKTITMWHLDCERGELTPHQVGASGKQVREYICLAYTADFEYLLAGSTTGDVAIVLMKNRVVQCHVHVCGGGVTNMVCVPASHGCRFIAAGGDGTVSVMAGPSAVDLREERSIRLDGPLSSLSLSPDMQEVLAVSTLGSAFLVRTKDLSMKPHSQVAPGALYDIAYPAGISDHFLTCCGDGLVTLWDANDYAAKLRVSVGTRGYPAAVCGTEDIFVAGSTDGKLHCWDSQQGQYLWHIDNVHKGGVSSVKLSSNVRFVVSAGVEGELRVWELKTREMISNLKEHGARVNDVQLFPNDQYAISVSRDRCLLTWDLRSEKRLTAHRERHGGINCLAVAANQTTVITSGQEKTMTTWDLRMADPVRVQELDEEVLSLSMSPDNAYVATGGTGQIVKVWDIRNDQQAFVASAGQGHSRAIQKLSFSPDGKQITSVGLDHCVMVWNCYT